MTLRLAEIRDLAFRFVPGRAADPRLYEYGARSWWPAHEIGHFLIATYDECRASQFDLDRGTPDCCFYEVTHELAAMSISQRLLRRAGHVKLADDEIDYTDIETCEASREPKYKRAVAKLLRDNRALSLPSTFARLEVRLMRKAHTVDTYFYPSRRAALR